MKREPIHDILTPPVAEAAWLAHRTWRIAAAALAFALAWILIAYWRTGVSMVAIWARSDTFAHGFVVAPIALWLIWRVRAELARVAPHPSWWVLVPLAAAGAGWLLGELGTVNALMQFSFVAMLVLAVPTILGIPAARVIAFPLAFLFFAVPTGEFVMPQLMEWTADVTVLALKLSGLPVYREGQNFIIPSGSWSVVEACSGVRYLIASLVIGTLYAYLTYRSQARRLVFIGFSIVVPIVANWARAYMIVMIGHLSSNKLAAGVDHLIYGWLFFGIVILLMFWIGTLWREDYFTPEASGPLVRIAGRASSPGKLLLVAVLVAIVTVVWPLGGRVIDRMDANSTPTFPAFDTVGAWQPTKGGLATWRPRFQNPSAELHDTFRQGNESIGLYVGYYRDQSSSHKLVSSENALVKTDDLAWARVGSGTRPIVVDGHPVDAATTELRGPAGKRLVVRRWYWIDGRLTASDARAKGYIALSQLMGRGDDAAVVMVYAAMDGPGEADAALDAFIRDAGPAIEAALARMRDRR